VKLLSKRLSKLLAITLVSLACTTSLLAADGKALFTAKCQMCHGADGKKMAPKADLTGDRVQERSDAELAKWIGTQPVHNFKKKGLSDGDIAAIVQYVRTLAPTK
jgi:mono/diheme cytochrome c family protein